MYLQRLFGEGPKDWIVFKLIILAFMMQSFKAWFFANLSLALCAVILLVVVLFYYNSKKEYFRADFSLFNPFFYLIAITISASHQNMNGLIAAVAAGLAIIPLSKLRHDLQKDIMDTIMNLMSIVLGISVLGWIAFLVGVNLPSTTIEISQYTFTNYYIFMDNEMYLADRFSSIFLEPGYLGCLCALFLYLGDYRFTPRNIVFYVSLGLTISLAGFIMAILGAILKYAKFNRQSLLYFAIAGTIVGGGWYYANNYNGGDNWLNEGIVLRLAFDQSTGSIAGDNRTTEAFDYWFWNQFAPSDDLLFGTGLNKIDQHSADWKVYIVNHGLLAFIFYILYLISPILKKNVFNRRNTIVFILINMMMFYQTCFGMHWNMYVFTFIFGLGLIQMADQNEAY